MSRTSVRHAGVSGRDAYAEVGEATRLAIEAALEAEPPLTPREHRLLLAWIHRTTSWSRLTDRCALGRLGKLAGIPDRRNLRRTIRGLLERVPLVYDPGIGTRQSQIGLTPGRGSGVTPGRGSGVTPPNENPSTRTFPEGPKSVVCNLPSPGRSHLARDSDGDPRDLSHTPPHPEGDESPESRHWVHVRQGFPQPDVCRLCREDAS